MIILMRVEVKKITVFMVIKCERSEFKHVLNHEVRPQNYL